MLQGSRHRQEPPARDSAEGHVTQSDWDVQIMDSIHEAPDQRQGMVGDDAYAARNLRLYRIAVSAKDGGDQGTKTGDHHLGRLHAQPAAAAAAAGGGVRNGETAAHHRLAASVLQPLHTGQRRQTSGMHLGFRSEHSGSKADRLRVKAHRQQQQPQSLGQRLAVWQQHLEQQSSKQRHEEDLQMDLQIESDQGYQQQQQQCGGVAAAAATPGNNTCSDVALATCAAGGSQSTGPSEANTARDDDPTAAAAVAAAFRGAHDNNAAVAAAGQASDPCSLELPRHTPTATGVDYSEVPLRPAAAAAHPAAAAVGACTNSSQLHSPAAKAAAAWARFMDTSLSRRSAAAKAEAAFKQQLQRAPKHPTSPDPAVEAITTAVISKINQGYLKIVEDERVWEERCEKKFGRPGFKPLLPHKIMEQDGGILDKARIMETGRLVAQVRREFDAGGEGSPTFEIYNDDDDKWCLAHDDERVEAPLVKLLDCKCMVNQPLVYSCQPVNYRSSPLVAEDLLSDCARATLVPASGVGNEIKCSNSKCSRHPHWQRCVYEQRHLKISPTTQTMPVYNSSQNWMLEKLGCSLQTFGMAVNAGYLNTVWCIYCKRGNSGVDPDSLKPCSTCPMACHKHCYKKFAGDFDIPEDDTPEDGAFWQCISCRQAAACAAAGCTWCEVVKPHLVVNELMEQWYGRLVQEVAAEEEAAAAAAQAAAAVAGVAAAAGGEGQAQPRKRKQQQQQGRGSGNKKIRRQGCQNVAESEPADSDTGDDDDADVREHAKVLMSQQKKPRLSAAGLQVDTTIHAVRILAASKYASPAGRQPTPAASLGAGISAAAAAAGSLAMNNAAPGPPGVGRAGSAPAASGGDATLAPSGAAPAAAAVGGHSSSQTAAAAEPADEFADLGVLDMVVDVLAPVAGGELPGPTAAAAEAQSAAQGMNNETHAAAAAAAKPRNDLAPAGGAADQIGPVPVVQVIQEAGRAAAQQLATAPGQGPAAPGPPQTTPTAAAGGFGVSRGPLKHRLELLKPLKDRGLLLEEEYRSVLRVLLGAKQEQLEQLTELVQLADAGDLTWEEFELLKQDVIATIKSK